MRGVGRTLFRSLVERKPVTSTPTYCPRPHPIVLGKVRTASVSTLSATFNKEQRNYCTSGSVPLPQPKVVEEFAEKSPKRSPLPISSFLSSSVGAKESLKMAEEKSVLQQYILPLDQPVVSLDCTEAFDGLTKQEKLYAHYLSEASWVGGLVVLVQTSPESPIIFTLLHDLFATNGIEGLKTIAVNDCSFTDDEWKALLIYGSGIFSQMGNYKGFGDTKIIPGLPMDKFGQLVSKAKFRTPEKEVTANWELVKDKIYSLSEKERQLGLGEKGVTTYFSANCTKEDADKMVRFLKSQNLEAWNSRCFKKVDGDSITYEMRSASAELENGNRQEYKFEGSTVVLTKGDYSPLMQAISDGLKRAQEYASNDTEKAMLGSYIKSFVEGAYQDHKEGSRHWIKDKGPVIETYIGFIETYRDPTGLRAEFEGFVAVVNKETSKKYAFLVDTAPEYVKLLPWGKDFERETFIKPDFTSLDVLTFAGSGIPAGINIPNYDEIRQNEGFKNVSLGNVIPASYKDAVIPFVTPEDKAMMDKYRIPAFSVQVALHELLGHGSGKLLKKNEDGTTNYSADLRNPLTGELIEQCYDHSDTYDSVFGDMGSAFEECRAEAVGLLLCLDKNILRDVFSVEGEEAENIIYTNWLSMVFAGAAKALEMYQPTTKSWMQAHSQARFTITRALIDAGEDFVQIKETVGADGKPDLLITLDRSKIDTVGRKAISDYLLKIQIYKSTADIKSAREMFGRLSSVDNEGIHPWAKWRDIIMDKRQPRKFFVQHNTVVEGDSVLLKNYEASPEGLIQSWIERFSDPAAVYKALEYNRTKDKEHF